MVESKCGVHLQKEKKKTKHNGTTKHVTFKLLCKSNYLKTFFLLYEMLALKSPLRAEII